jgi:hypothetical protein
VGFDEIGVDVFKVKGEPYLFPDPDFLRFDPKIGDDRHPRTG